MMTISRSEVFEAIFKRACFADSRSAVWRNRSPHVYPVIESSGKTNIPQSCSAACLAASMIFDALKAVSATLTSGVAAPTLIKESTMGISLRIFSDYTIKKRSRKEPLSK